MNKSRKNETESLLKTFEVQRSGLDQWSDVFLNINRLPCKLVLSPTSQSTVLLWETISFQLDPTNSMGCVLKRSCFGAIVLAIASEKSSSSVVIEGSVLYDINGVIVVAESFQSIIERLESVTTFPLCLRLISDGMIYDAIFWEKDTGIVWCRASELAQVESIANDGSAYARGIRSGDVIIQVDELNIHLLKYEYIVNRLKGSKEDSILIIFTGTREVESNIGILSSRYTGQMDGLNDYKLIENRFIGHFSSILCACDLSVNRMIEYHEFQHQHDNSFVFSRWKPVYAFCGIMLALRQQKELLSRSKKYHLLHSSNLFAADGRNAEISEHSKIEVFMFQLCKLLKHEEIAAEFFHPMAKPFSFGDDYSSVPSDTLHQGIYSRQLIHILVESCRGDFDASCKLFWNLLSDFREGTHVIDTMIDSTTHIHSNKNARIHVTSLEIFLAILFSHQQLSFFESNFSLLSTIFGSYCDVTSLLNQSQLLCNFDSHKTDSALFGTKGGNGRHTEDSENVDSGIDLTWRSCGSDDCVTLEPSIVEMTGMQELLERSTCFSLYDDCRQKNYISSSTIGIILSKQYCLATIAQTASKAAHEYNGDSHDVREVKLRVSLTACLSRQPLLWPVPSPLRGDVYLLSMIVSKCKLMKSSKHPTLLVFNTISAVSNESTPVKPSQRMILYKRDDDVSQDVFVLQVIRLIDRMLKADNLDLKLLVYNVMSTDCKEGFIEWVDGAEPLSAIIKDFGSDSNPIQAYMRKQHYSAVDPFFINKSVIDTYIRSCAGYSVITYLLGVGDRHLDNILMRASGELLHVDFGYIFGQDPKPFKSELRFTHEMLLAMGGEHSFIYGQFLLFCTKAYNSIRRSAPMLLNFIRITVDANISDLSVRQNPLDVIKTVSEKLHLEMDDVAATNHIRSIIINSVSAIMPAVMESLHRISVSLY